VLFVQIVVPPLPSKALSRQLPFRGDDGLFEEDFIEERRAGLEAFVNRYQHHYHMSDSIVKLFIKSFHKYLNTDSMLLISFDVSIVYSINI
jgi:hypothetical protein